MTPQPHLAVVAPDLRGGGCERIIAALLPDLAAIGQVDLVLQRADLDYPVPDGIPVRSLGIDTSARHSLVFKAWRVLRRVRALRQCFDQGRYDLILSFIDLNNVFAYRANRTSRRPAPLVAVEQTVCAEFFRYNPYARRYAFLMKPLLGHVYRRTERLVALSRSMADYLRADLAVDRAVDVIYNGLDTRVFHPADRYPANPAGDLDPHFLQAPVRLVTVGRLEFPQKNQPFLVRLFPRLLAACPDAHLFVIGQGEDESALRALIADLGLGERVHLLGWQRHLADYLRAADALLHAARYETFGNVLVESLACGTPVVVADSCAVYREILDDGRQGTLVRPDAPEAFVQAVAAAVQRGRSEPAWRLTLAEFAQRTFDIRQTCRQYVDVVRQELARPRARGV